MSTRKRGNPYHAKDGSFTSKARAGKDAAKKDDLTLADLTVGRRNPGSLPAASTKLRRAFSY